MRGRLRKLLTQLCQLGTVLLREQCGALSQQHRAQGLPLVLLPQVLQIGRVLAGDPVHGLDGLTQFASIGIYLGLEPALSGVVIALAIGRA